MKGTVESVTKSKTGKSWRVKIGSEFYGANFDSKIDSMLGKPIDFEWTDGQFGKWLQSWGPDTSQNIPNVGSSLPNLGIKGNGDRWWLPFCSNQIAHLIQVGVIKDKATLNQWAKDLKDCVTALDTL